MRRFVSIGAAWLTATLVAVAIAAAAVGSVRSEVTGTPTAFAAPIVAANSTVSAPDSGTPTTTTSDVPELPTTTVTSTDSNATTTTTETHEDESPVTTTTPPVTSSTTPTASHTKTFDTEAGSVRIIVSGESVTFAGATPLPGWTVELENGGPNEVEVHFERNEHEDEEEEIEFKATIEDGELKVSISTET